MNDQDLPPPETVGKQPITLTAHAPLVCFLHPNHLFLARYYLSTCSKWWSPSRTHIRISPLFNASPFRFASFRTHLVATCRYCSHVKGFDLILDLCHVCFHVQHLSHGRKTRCASKIWTPKSFCISADYRIVCSFLPNGSLFSIF